MNKKLAITFLILALSLLLISGCKKVYVCYDGTTQDNERDCPIVPYPKITEKAAKSAVDKWGYAYASAKSDRFTQVNTFADKYDWKSDVLFTNSRTEEVNAITLKIDGKTATITCLTGCNYVGLTTPRT